MSMRSNRLVSGRARSKLRIAQKVRRQLTAAHSSDLLPLLPSGPGGVHRVRCAGPAPDLLHHTISLCTACAPFCALPDPRPML